jgi:hypothetical protein
MCIIACKEAGVRWPSRKIMRNCYDNNTDGAGIAWLGKDGFHIEKGYFGWKSLWRDLRALEEYPVMVHCRLATHGSIKAENCHPFLLRNGAAMSHNGILSGVKIPPGEDTTDSEVFCREYLDNFSIKELRMKKVSYLMSMAIGRDKIAILCPDGADNGGADSSFIIYNKELGEEHDGVWFSNKTFMYDVGHDNPYRGYTRYSSPYRYAPLWEDYYADYYPEQAAAEYADIKKGSGELDAAAYMRNALAYGIPQKGALISNT